MNLHFELHFNEFHNRHKDGHAIAYVRLSTGRSRGKKLACLRQHVENGSIEITLTPYAKENLPPSYCNELLNIPTECRQNFRTAYAEVILTYARHCI